MRRLSTQDQNFKQVFADLLAFETVSDPELIKTVDQIIADVRQHGDAHVLKLTQQFDRHPAHHFSDLELSQAQLKAAGINTNSKQYKSAVKQMMSAGNGAMYGNIQGIKNLMSHYDKDGDYINPVNIVNDTSGD